MNDVINEVKTKDYRAELDYEYHAEDPRIWDNNSTMICSHGSYELGDIQGQGNLGGWMDELIVALINAYDVEIEEHYKELTEDEVEELLDKTVYLPLYLYDHSGITMNTTGFHSRWDSGQVGWIFMTEEQVDELEGDYFEKRKKAKELLKSQVATYDKYISGQVYRVTIYKRNKCECCGKYEEEYFDSCGGLYDISTDYLTSFFGNEFEDLLTELLNF